MSLKRKLGVTATVGCLAVGVLGASASPASAARVQLTTGLNSPQGTHTVVAPEAATSGALNAFTQVTTKGPGDLSNINATILP